MTNRLKQLTLGFAKACGLFRISRWLTGSQLRILCYHGIWLGEADENPFNYLYMHPARFARRMSLLRGLGYPVLPLSEALRRLDDGTLPSSAVVITIDDGWYGTYRFMVPELEAHKFSATIYLTTYHVEKQTAVFGVALHYLLQKAPIRRLDCSRLSLPARGMVDLDDPSQRDSVHGALCAHAADVLEPLEREALLARVASELGMDWTKLAEDRYFHLMTVQEAQESAARGIDFQLHTHRHRVSVDGVVCIAEEIAANRTRLSAISSARAEHFCYPSGEWEPSHLPHLRAAGVISATTTENGLCKRETERLALPRILDGDRVSELEFEAELAGFMEIKRRLISRISKRAKYA